MLLYFSGGHHDEDDCDDNHDEDGGDYDHDHDF